MYKWERSSGTSLVHTNRPENKLLYKDALTYTKKRFITNCEPVIDFVRDVYREHQQNEGE